MPPRRCSTSSTGFLKQVSFNSQGRVVMIDEEVQSSSRERMVLPQHLQDMAACASKITIVSDNAKAPPLSPWSPLFREERGLPPLGGGDSFKNSSSDGSRRKSESRWDSMPQPKRLSDDSIAPFPSLAKIRQCGYLQGQDIGYGIPMPDNNDDDGPCSPTSSNNHDSENNNHNNEEKPERGLNLPRRRESIEVSRDFPHADSVSLLSQVLSAFDLSDEEDEDGDNFVLPPPPPGRFSLPTQPMARQVLRDSRPALSPEQTEKKVGSDTLSIPVRRASIDSVDFLLSEEDLEGFFTDEDDTEHADHAGEFDDSFEEEDDDEETEFYDETEDGDEDDSSTDEDEDEDSFHNHQKDDCTLVSATTSTTMSTLRSTDERDMPRR